jgi:hypothetical protein
MFDINQVATLTGLTYQEMLVKLDEQLPAAAYTAVPGGANLTDIDPNYMRLALTEVFGLSGFGWGYRYSPDLVETRQETRKTNNGTREVVVASVKHLVFWYKLAMPDGEVVVCEVPSTGASENSNDAYAMSGAVTNAIGKATSNILFQNSVYLGKRSHVTVRKPQAGATTKAAAPAKPAAKTPAKPAAPAPAKPAAPAVANDDMEDLDSTPAVPVTGENPAEFIIPLGKRTGEKLGEQEPKVIAWYATSLVADNAEKQALQAAARSLLATLQPA